MPTTVIAKPEDKIIQVAEGGDVEVILGTKRNGPLKVVCNGGKVIIRNGDLCGNRLIVSGHATRVDVISVRTDVSSGDPRDALNISGNFDTFVIDLCRFTGVHGRQNTIHGDCVQVTDGCSVGLLLVRRCTFQSCYQIFMLKKLLTGIGVSRFIMERTNILNNPSQREQQSVALLLMGDGAAKIELRADCWIDWPGQNWHRIAKGENVTVTGTWNVGVPPMGDFCP